MASCPTRRSVTSKPWWMPSTNLASGESNGEDRQWRSSMKQMSMEVFLTVVVICALPVLFGGAIRSFVLSYSEKNFAIAGLSHCPEVKPLLGDRITEVRTF